MLVDTSAVDSYDSLMHRDDAESTPINPAAASSGSGQGSVLPFTRRRLAMLVAGLFALWLVGVFAPPGGGRGGGRAGVGLPRPPVGGGGVFVPPFLFGGWWFFLRGGGASPGGGKT